jgi:hypothetical protein
MVALTRLSIASKAVEDDERGGYRPRVTLLDGGFSVVAIFTALTDCDVTRASTIEALERLLPATDVIVGEWGFEVAKLFRTSGRAVPFVHVGSLGDGVIDAAADGQMVGQAETIDEVQAKVFELTRAPRSPVARQAIAGLSLSWGGHPSSFEVVDLSNEGVSFAVDAGTEIDDLLPGAIIEELQVRRGQELCLTDGVAVVRHIIPDHRGRAQYRIGCELIHRQRGDRRVIAIRDRALRAGLLRAAVGAGQIQLEAEDGTCSVFADAGELRLADELLCFDRCKHSFEAFSIVRGRFELHGRSYRFLSTILSTSPLQLRLPTVLEEAHQRNSARVPLKPSLPVSLRSPLTGRWMTCDATDLSASGLSFDFEAEALFPRGLRIREIRIPFGGQVFYCAGRVQNLARTRSGYRAGIEFEDFDESARVQLAESLTRVRFPAIDDGAPLVLEALMAFFRDAGFMPPEKERLIERQHADVKRTFERLNARPNQLFKSIVIRDENRLTGYVSGVQAYQDTWMFQHLAALPGRAAGLVLSQALVDYLMHHSEFEYFKMWFHSRNAFPARIFGGFARKLVDERISDLRAYAHLTVDTHAVIPPSHPSIETREATDADLAVVEQHFVSRERGVLLKSDGLTRRQLRLSELDERFGKFDLHRRRKVLIAAQGGRVLGFALAEISSPGMNLSEGLSSFRLHLLPAANGCQVDVRAALLRALQRVYAREGRASVLGLVPPGEVAEYERLGLHPDAESLCWTCHRSQLPRFFAHMARLEERLSGRRNRERASQ